MLVDARFYDVRFTAKRVAFDLADERTIEIPIEWFPLLQVADKEAREVFEIEADGSAIVWPRLGERVSVEAVMLVRTTPDARMVPMPGKRSWGGLAERGFQFTHTDRNG